MLHQRLEHRELTGGEHVHLVALLQLAGRQRQLVFAEGDGLVLAGRGAGHLRRLPAQHRTDAREQLARVERLGQVVVGALLQALDAAGLVALGGEHDDRDLIVRLTQPAAGGQPVLARHHQVQHHQLKQLATEQAVHLLGVFHGTDAVALLVEKALEQTPQTGIVIDDKDLFAFVGLRSAAHGNSQMVDGALLRSVVRPY